MKETRASSRRVSEIKQRRTEGNWTEDVYKRVNKNTTNTIFCSDCLPLFEVKLANEVYSLNLRGGHVYIYNWSSQFVHIKRYKSQPGELFAKLHDVLWFLSIKSIRKDTTTTIMMVNVRVLTSGKKDWFWKKLLFELWLKITIAYSSELNGRFRSATSLPVASLRDREGIKHRLLEAD